MGQSMSILRSLGIQYGYYDPADWKTSFYTDAIIDCWVEVFESLAKIMFGMPNESEEKKQEEIDKAVKEINVPMLNLMEK